MRTKTSKTTGLKIIKGIGASRKWLPPDHPIYTRGFTIGFTMGGPAWPRAATGSSATHTPPPPVIDSTEPQGDAHKRGR